VTSSTAITKFNTGTSAGTIISENTDAGTCGVCQASYGPIGGYCFPCPSNCNNCS